jgi:hypothetical protein
MKFPIVWVSETVPQIEETETYVFPDLEKIFRDLEKAEDLIFHTIFIGASTDGPIVMAYGKENDPNVYLDYLDDVQWMIEQD